MADDIVDRLREHVGRHDDGVPCVRCKAADEIERLRAVQVVDPAAIPTEVLADIDSQLCDDCDPFTSERIVCRLWQHGWRITRG